MVLLAVAVTVAITETLLELLDATFGVDEALLAREEWVVSRPHIDVDFRLRAVRFHNHFAVTNDVARNHLRVNIFFHDLLLSSSRYRALVF